MYLDEKDPWHVTSLLAFEFGMAGGLAALAPPYRRTLLAPWDVTAGSCSVCQSKESSQSKDFQSKEIIESIKR